MIGTALVDAFFSAPLFFVSITLICQENQKRNLLWVQNASLSDCKSWVHTETIKLLASTFQRDFTYPVAFQGVTSAFPFYLVAKFLRAVTCKFCVDWSWRVLICWFILLHLTYSAPPQHQCTEIVDLTIFKPGAGINIFPLHLLEGLVLLVIEIKWLNCRCRLDFDHVIASWKCEW